MPHLARELLAQYELFLMCLGGFVTCVTIIFVTCVNIIFAKLNAVIRKPKLIAAHEKCLFEKGFWLNHLFFVLTGIVQLDQK